MTSSRITSRPAVTAVAFALAGAGFVVYPALRPYSDETTLAGAEAMSSTAWVLAHSVGMLAFLALTVAVWSLRRTVPGLRQLPAAVAAVLTWLGVSLVLPYYGGETFALQVIAERAATEAEPGLLELADAFRYQPVAIASFGAGLLALAAAGVSLATALRDSGTLGRAGGLLVGLGLVLYLPQFFVAPAGRIGHGVLLAAGCAALAVLGRRAGTAQLSQTVPSESPSRYQSYSASTPETYGP
ncbi:hypothetical protein KZX45_17125 [Georgenia sp. EYE_87]|uniref:hypothetical protein n=1 Tax=Georgenia sp. EYE_87 TaxID=2853448 RepID=UPI0020057043|nr:hypothetical protein [Georgenia sp. EYE_87]MCK6212267.1 hypothetical protein [Georgenia sp. EYE_87]